MLKVKILVEKISLSNFLVHIMSSADKSQMVKNALQFLLLVNLFGRYNSSLVTWRPCTVCIRLFGRRFEFPAKSQLFKIRNIFANVQNRHIKAFLANTKEATFVGRLIYMANLSLFYTRHGDLSVAKMTSTSSVSGLTLPLFELAIVAAATQ